MVLLREVFSPFSDTIVRVIVFSPAVLYVYCCIESHSAGVRFSQKSKMNFLISPSSDSEREASMVARVGT